MPFEIEFTQAAADQVRAYRAFDQQIILDGIELQLLHEPAVETRNKKHLVDNELFDWELRLGKFRVFYDVSTESDSKVVKVKAVGHKVHNKLYIGSKEVNL